MRSMSSLPYFVFAGILLCSTALICTPALPAQEVAPAIRIVDWIDESNLVTLKGNTHPAANAKNDRGPVSPDLRMTDLILVLSRSPEQQAAFDQFVASQYDPNSPNFHHWLTPAEVGQNFGPSENDIAAISAWLTGHGFSVDQIPNDHMSIRFSGTAAQVESAFHTEIHNLSVRGAAHIGNMSDPKIPAALAPVVVGVKALHNFFPRPAYHLGSQVTRDSQTGKWKRVSNPSSAGETTLAAGRSARARPEFGVNVPASGGSSAYQLEDVSPYDFATIYNVLPLWSAGTPIDGRGQTIAVAATSAINAGITVIGGNGENDVAAFRSTFGLPAYSANQFTMVSGNSEPLAVCTDTTGMVPYESNPCEEGDLIENSLDVEWSGAIAKGANIVLVSSYPASVSDDGLYDSESYIVDHLTAHIMNVSYGECELGNGTAGNVEYYNLWQTAASEGIAVFTATGDAGSASCDDGGDESGVPYAAEYGLTVSGLASTPYDTAVGGTDFNWCSLTTTTECTPAPYWNSTNASNGSSAIGYVPEIPWNDTCAGSLGAAFVYWLSLPTQTNLGGVEDAESACNFVINNYQSIYDATGLDLAPLVDTIGGGGGASGCVVSVPNSTPDEPGTCTAGATTTGTANGSITLVNNGWPKPSWQEGVIGIPSDGVRDIPDVSFFASDGVLSSSAYLICVSYVGPCTYSTNSEPTAQEVGGTSVATPAMSGVMALINQKTRAPQGSPNAELYNLAAQQTYSDCSAERGNGAPVTSSSCLFNDIDAGNITVDSSLVVGNNSVPCDYTHSSPNCAILHSGDEVGILGISAGNPGYQSGTGYDLATGLGSLNVANVVNAWPATVGTPVTVTVVPAQPSIASNQSLGVTGTVASSPSGGVTPTGTVTLTAGTYTSSMELSNTGSYSFTIPANSLSAGTDTLNVAYSGDATYAASPTNTATVIVTAAQTITFANPGAQTVGTQLTLYATASSGLTVSYTSTTTSVCRVSGATATFIAAGTCTIDANQAGNSTYAAAPMVQQSFTVNAAASSPTISSFTASPTSITSGSSSTLSWATTGATSIAITPGSFTSTSASGSTTVSPMATTTYTLTATNTAGSTTATATVTVTGGAAGATFTLAASAAAPSSISAGQAATSTITVSSSNGYTGTVTLTCTGATGNPTNAAGDAPICTSTNAASVAVGGTATFTISNIVAATTTSGVANPELPGKGRGWEGASGGAVLALLVLFGIPARRRGWRSTLGILLVMAALGNLTACGGSKSTPPQQNIPGTTAGTYTFTVTGTGNPSVTPAPTIPFTVTVN